MVQVLYEDDPDLLCIVRPGATRGHSATVRSRADSRCPRRLLRLGLCRPTRVALQPRSTSHFWFFDVYVNSHQHGHWVEGTAYLSGALRRFHKAIMPRTGLPPVTGVFIPKVRPPFLSDIESIFLYAAVSPFNVSSVKLYVTHKGHD